ncbi:hypothetical protein T10_7590, partial [Trichinella papuae]
LTDLSEEERRKILFPHFKQASKQRALPSLFSVWLNIVELRVGGSSVHFVQSKRFDTASRTFGQKNLNSKKRFDVAIKQDAVVCSIRAFAALSHSRSLFQSVSQSVSHSPCRSVVRCVLLLL